MKVVNPLPINDTEWRALIDQRRQRQANAKLTRQALARRNAAARMAKKEKKKRKRRKR